MMIKFIKWPSILSRIISFDKKEKPLHLETFCTDIWNPIEIDMINDTARLNPLFGNNYFV